MEKLPSKPDIICIKCKTVYGEKDESCPACGCKLVRLVHVDGRQPFTVDNRRVQPK